MEAEIAAQCALLDTDPLCINEYLATKGVMEGNVSFDDRAYVRIG